MSTDSLHFAGVVLITVPAIAFGGVRLLTMIFRREPGYLDHPVRQNLWRAGHAHAGVLVRNRPSCLAVPGEAHDRECVFVHGDRPVH